MNLSSPLYTTAISPDGTVLAAAGADRQVSLWNITDPSRPIPFGKPLAGPGQHGVLGGVQPVRSPAGGGQRGRHRPAVERGQPAGTRPCWPRCTGRPGTWSRSRSARRGDVLAAGSADKTVRLWSVADPAKPVSLGKPLTGPADIVTSVAFGPDGQACWPPAARTTRSGCGTCAAAPAPVPKGTLTGATDWVNAVAFSPDGQQAGRGQQRQPRLRVEHGHQVADRAAAAGGSGHLAGLGRRRSQLVAGDADGTVSIWSLPSPVLMAGRPVNSVAFSPTGNVLAVGSQILAAVGPGDPGAADDGAGARVARS